MESDEDGGDDGASDAIVDDVDGSANEWIFFFFYSRIFYLYYLCEIYHKLDRFTLIYFALTLNVRSLSGDVHIIWSNNSPRQYKNPNKMISYVNHIHLIYNYK